MADESWESLIAEAGDRFNIPPEGEYQAVITEAVPGVAKSSGNPKIEVKLKIAEGPESGKKPKAVHVTKSAKAASIFLRHLQAVGIQPEALLDQKPTMGQIAAVMIDKRVTVKIKHAEWRGEKQAEVEWNMRPPAGGATPVTNFPKVAPEQELGYADAGASSAPPTPGTPSAPTTPSGPPTPQVSEDPGF